MPSEFLEEFAQMALELHDASVPETVERITEHALKAIGCQYAGVVFVQRGGEVSAAATTDPLVTEMEKLQADLGEGPDVEVFEERYGVIVSDTMTETRWPRWAKLAAEAGLRSMLGVRLYTSSTTVGTLNLYDPEPNKFDVSDQQVAHVLARHAAVALTSARQMENLWQAIDSRKRIGQAQGMLMERYQLTEDQAFSVLLRYSQDKNLKLRAVAEMLVTTRDLPDRRDDQRDGQRDGQRPLGNDGGRGELSTGAGA